MKTKMEGFSIRKAMESDVDLLLELIQGLAGYEKMTDSCVATREVQRNFSTFLAIPGIYLEDLYVKPEMRSRGFGKALLSYLGKLAVDTVCGRLEWTCLKWNDPSIHFYRRMGARPMSEWTTYREEAKHGRNWPVRFNTRVCREGL